MVFLRFVAFNARSRDGVSRRSSHCGFERALRGFRRHCCACVRAVRERRRRAAPSTPSASAATRPRSTSPASLERQRATPTASRSRPRRAPTASSAASRCARAKAATNWIVFALANNTDEQVDRLLVAPHFRLVGSGLLWPDLGVSRIAAITPRPATARSGRTAPTPTSSASRSIPAPSSPSSPSCAPTSCRSSICGSPTPTRTRSTRFTLYKGIVIGIAGLLALFLTILFVVKGSMMFPAAAALAWAVLVYIGIDFGFWGKVFDMSSGAERVWRASGEAILAGDAAGLPVRLSQSQPLARALHRTSRVGWLAFLAALVALALFDPPVASGIARMSLALIAVLGFGAGRLSLDPRLRPRRAADPDLVPAGGLGDRRRHDGHRAASPTTSSARPCSAAWC